MTCFNSVQETKERDKLFVTGITDVLTEGKTVLTGQGVLQRGSVLGRVSASGKLKLCDTASVDGSETPYGVLAKTIDTTASDVDAPVYLTGSFNDDPAVLIFGGTTLVSDVWTAMRMRGMFALPADPIY